VTYDGQLLTLNRYTQQRFLAATPKHPAILESLKEFKKWRLADGKQVAVCPLDKAVGSERGMT
jgi:hypothetical protein